MPHICPVLADVGFHGCLPVTLYWQQVLRLMVIYILQTQGRGSWNPTSAKTGQIWGTPSFVTEQAVRNAG